jgi:broad specificity phosphatase PhoE
MARNVYFITHPDVLISPDVPVPRWPLSEKGKARMRRCLNLPWIREITAVYCSDEQKAIDAATILADHLSLAFQVNPGLGENDRTATGFLPPAEFEKTADGFFARPEESIRGWEKAADAQRRIVRAVEGIVAGEGSSGAIAMVSHGAVGTLLYCHLSGKGIDRRGDQPPNGGGNYFCFSLAPRKVGEGWMPIDGSESG